MAELKNLNAFMEYLILESGAVKEPLIKPLQKKKMSDMKKKDVTSQERKYPSISSTTGNKFMNKLQKLSFPTLKIISDEVTKFRKDNKQKIITDLTSKNLGINASNIDSYFEGFYNYFSEIMGEKVVRKDQHIQSIVKHAYEGGFNIETNETFFPKGIVKGDDVDLICEEILKNIDNNISKISNFALADFQARINNYYYNILEFTKLDRDFLSPKLAEIYLSDLKNKVDTEVSRRKLKEPDKIFYDDTILAKLESDVKKSKKSEEEITDIIRSYTHGDDKFINNVLRGNYTFIEADKECVKLKLKIHPKRFYEKITDIYKIISKYFKPSIDNGKSNSTSYYVYRGFRGIGKFMTLIGLNTGECLKKAYPEVFNQGTFADSEGTKKSCKRLSNAVELIERGKWDKLDPSEKKVLPLNIIKELPEMLANSFNLPSNAIYHEQGILSTFKKLMAARNFIQPVGGIKNGVLLTIEVKNKQGRNISRVSQFKTEEEIIFPPNTKVKIKSKGDFKDNILNLFGEIT